MVKRAMEKPVYSLKEVKRIIKETPDNVIIRGRACNNLSLLGIRNIKEALSIITDKLHQGHFRGISPKAGDSYADEYIINISKVDIYIKLKISNDDLDIISFHKDNFK